MGVVPRGAAGRQPPLGDADLGRVDLNLGSGGDHRTSLQTACLWVEGYRMRHPGGQPSLPQLHCLYSAHGTKTRNRNTAKATMWTSPNRMLVRPVPNVSMLRKKVSNSSTM